MPRPAVRRRVRVDGDRDRQLGVPRRQAAAGVAGLGAQIEGQRCLARLGVLGQPDLEQQIAAKLVSWGVAPDGMRLPVSDEAVDRHIRMLQSPIGEKRVRAARWLSARGVRRGEEAIAEAMTDPGTARPCQLAHELGGLGSNRWVDTLANAARNPSSTDLRVCATIALGKVASPKAVQALSEVYEQGTAAILFSVIRTCERHQVDPFAYLRDVLARLPDHPINQLDELLPDHWQPLT